MQLCGICACKFVSEKKLCFAHFTFCAFLRICARRICARGEFLRRVGGKSFLRGIFSVAVVFWGSFWGSFWGVFLGVFLGSFWGSFWGLFGGPGGPFLGSFLGSGTDPPGGGFRPFWAHPRTPFFRVLGVLGSRGDPPRPPHKPSPTPPPSAPVVYIYCRTSPKSTQIRPPTALPLCLRGFLGDPLGGPFWGVRGTLLGGSGGDPFWGSFWPWGGCAQWP